jgi:hypothetical protein
MCSFSPNNVYLPAISLWKTGVHNKIFAFQWQLTSKWIRRASQSFQNWTTDFSSCTCWIRILSHMSLWLCRKVMSLRVAKFGRKLHGPRKYSTGYVWSITYNGQGMVLQKKLVNAERNNTWEIIAKIVVSSTLWSRWVTSRIPYSQHNLNCVGMLCANKQKM